MLDAAEALLAAEGAGALTTTRVAAAAGVSVGSLYQYLPDKEAIVEALANRYLAEFEALMESMTEAAAAGGEPWADPVGRLIDAFARRYRDRPGYRALWFGREMTPALREADRENKLALAVGLRRRTGRARAWRPTGRSSRSPRAPACSSPTRCCRRRSAWTRRATRR